MRRVAISCTFLLFIAMSIFWLTKNKEPVVLKADEAVNASSMKEAKEATHHPYAWGNSPNTLDPKDDRNRKVQNQLDKFMNKTSHIAAASVAREREKIAQGLEKALSQKAEQPRVRHEVDEKGETWEELRFSDDVVRYLPLPERENRL